MFAQMERLLVNMNAEERHALITAALINTRLPEDIKSAFLAQLAGEVYEYNKFKERGLKPNGNTR